MDDLSTSIRHPGGLADIPKAWPQHQLSGVLSAVKFGCLAFAFFFSKKSGCKTETYRKIVDVFSVIVYFNVKDSMLFGECHTFRDAVYLKLKSMLLMLFHDLQHFMFFVFLVFVIHKKTNRRHSPFVGPSFGVFCWRFFLQVQKG